MHWPSKLVVCPAKPLVCKGKTSGLLRKTKSKNRALALRKRLGVSPNIQSSGLNIDGEGHGSGEVGSCNFCSQKMHNMTRFALSCFSSNLSLFRISLYENLKTKLTHLQMNRFIKGDATRASNFRIRFFPTPFL